MLSCSLNPTSLSKLELDNLLESGFFRAGQTMFTTSFLHLSNQYLDAVWLRIKLDEFEATNETIRVSKRATRFKTIVREAFIDNKKESLFQLYKDKASFVNTPSLYQLLFENKFEETIFHSYEVCVFDEGKLIACGFFDLGEKSAMGINCFYDPSYSSFSLGKYLIYRKILFCKEMGLDYFYPGYFAPGFSRFDYKLQLTQKGLSFYALQNREWLPISTWNEEYSILGLMKKKLSELQLVLNGFSLSTELKYYRHFDASLYPNQTFKNFLEYPIVLQITEYSSETELCLCVYDVFEGVYQIIQSYAVFELLESESTNEELMQYVLDFDSVIFESSNLEELIQMMLA